MRSSFAAALVGAVSLVSTASACTGDEDGPLDPGNDACLSNRDYFEQRVWAPLMSRTCITCHQPGGVAFEEQARLLLLPPSYPGFLDANLAALAEVSRIEYDGVSEILLKPTARVPHGGGEVVEVGSREYQALEELLRRIRDGEPDCGEQPMGSELEGVELLSPEATLRKAAIDLAGRLPTEAELAAVRDGGEPALREAVRALTTEAAFYDWLRTSWNDVLLTDLYMSYRGRSVGLLRPDDFPNTRDDAENMSWFDRQDDATRDRITRAVAREPLDLIVHVVRNDRPFSEILTADYMVVNPASAAFYEPNLREPVSFADATNDDELVETHLVVRPDRDDRANYPHAGLLTSPMWLNRFPTTPTNRSRHRARNVLRLFLATDILRVAERPVDPLAATEYPVPTRNDPSCAVCHRLIDPIAGGFQKFDDSDQERFVPMREWFGDMEAPGFGNEVIMTSESLDSAGWLADRVVRDPRFSLAAVYTTYHALLGRAPLTYPTDTEAADFESQRNAWQAQDDELDRIRRAFVSSSLDFRTMVVELVLSPYYRASAFTGTADSARLVEIGELGTARLGTPEHLSRKIAAITGAPWTRSATDRRMWMTTDYRILYGGIDSEAVTARLTTPNGVMAAVQSRMANEVACRSTAWDFTHDAANRRLFPLVEAADAPETATGDIVPAARDRIRENIRHLHARVLGEDLAPDDPELERTYTLFLETWREGSAAVRAMSTTDRLPGACRARQDLTTGTDLPEAERIERDPDYTIRAWMAVVTYLLSDYRFLYD